MVNLELDGSPSLFESLPALEITWHKFQKETYCNTARLIFESPLEDDLVKISVTIRNIIAPGKPEQKTVDYTVYNFLPCRRDNGLVCAAINSTKLVEAIGLCGFTKNSDGDYSNLVRYPISISYKYSGIEESFAFIDQLPPLLICKNVLGSIKAGEKLASHINLSK